MGFNSLPTPCQNMKDPISDSGPQSSEPPGARGPSPVSLRGAAADAARYWERGRIGYNLILASVAAAWLGFTWPHFRPALTVRSGLLLLVLAAIANLCYCAAYPVDIAIQFSPFRAQWMRRRWILWCAGAVFAALLACYWIGDEIYPSVG